MKTMLFLRFLRGTRKVATRKENASSWAKRSLPNDHNILLMGSPGSGKTSAGQILAERLKKPVIDIDNDYLESYWGMTVEQKLASVGNGHFLKEEGDALLKFDPPRGSIISLTGSNPLHTQAMRHVTSTGLAVFIDVHPDDIVRRLHEMKVDRVVTHRDGQSLDEVLLYRRNFYEIVYDVRVLCERREPIKGVADKVEREIHRFGTPQLYRSTRNTDATGQSGDKRETNAYRFNDVVLRGLADDGGLFVPDGPFPRLTPGEWTRLVEMSYQERALRILERWIHPGDVHSQILRTFVHQAYDGFSSADVAPLVDLRGNQFLVELFHGPTASFKDLALQLMPKFFAHAVAQRGSKTKYFILVATSGDTGSAVLDGFSKSAGCDVKVMVLYPEHGISSVQKALMTSVNSSDVRVLGVDGDFDSCQSIIKSVFNNPHLTGRLMGEFNTRLSAANSINWGRLLPQVVYHASAYLDLVKKGVISMGEECDVCIPTGNFGNILAAFYAREMGIPFKRFICASNVNNILSEFFHSGVYDLRQRRLRVSSSPAIDILKSSNLERFLHLVTGGNGHLVGGWFRSLDQTGAFSVGTEVVEKISKEYNLISDWCNEDECARNIKRAFKETGYLMDPHTSVAQVVADRYRCDDRPMLISSTAHCSKFPEDVLAALGVHPNRGNCSGMLNQLEAISDRPGSHRVLGASVARPVVHETVIGPRVKEVTDEIVSFCAGE